MHNFEVAPSGRANDKAIEAESVYLNTKSLIDKLDKKGIDMFEYHQQLGQINDFYMKETERIRNNKSFGIAKRGVLEQIYSRKINDLQKLQYELEKYDVYFTSEAKCSELNEVLNNSEDLTSEQIQKMVDSVLLLLHQITFSDTRIYIDEQQIVEKIYSIAYKIMKQEIRVFGKSKIFNWVKNSAVSGFFEAMVHMDIKALAKDNVVYGIIHSMITKIETKGIPCSYLDESLILYLTLADEGINKEDIKNDLLHLYEEIQKNEGKIRVVSYDYTNFLNKSENKNKDVIKEIHSLRKSILARISFQAVIALSIIGVGIGGFHIAKVMKRWNLENYDLDASYTTGDTLQTSLKENKSVKDTSKESVIEVISYEPWQLSDESKNIYTRNVVTKEMDYEKNTSLEDYISKEGTIIKNEVETGKNPKDFYDETIFEVMRYIRDDNIHIISEFGDEMMFAILCALLDILILVLINEITSGISVLITDTRSKIDLLKQHKYKSSKEQEEGKEKIKEYIDAYKRLYQENEEFREKFDSLYERYKEFVADNEVKEAQMKLARTKPKEAI